MGLAQDLLQQADHLAAYEGVNPSQASLRRSVSTAYYALFHLLIDMPRHDGKVHRRHVLVSNADSSMDR